MGNLLWNLRANSILRWILTLLLASFLTCSKLVWVIICTPKGLVWIICRILRLLPACCCPEFVCFLGNWCCRIFEVAAADWTLTPSPGPLDPPSTFKGFHWPWCTRSTQICRDFSFPGLTRNDSLQNYHRYRGYEEFQQNDWSSEEYTPRSSSWDQSWLLISGESASILLCFIFFPPKIEGLSFAFQEWQEEKNWALRPANFLDSASESWIFIGKTSWG